MENIENKVGFNRKSIDSFNIPKISTILFNFENNNIFEMLYFPSLLPSLIIPYGNIECLNARNFCLLVMIRFVTRLFNYVY